jgi:hypothetical protein
MANPNLVHIDAALTNISVAYQNGAYIGTEALSEVKVANRSDSWHTIDEATFFSEVNDLSDGDIANPDEIDIDRDSDSYQIVDHADRGWVSDAERDNADPAIDPEAEVTEVLTNNLLLRHERRSSLLLFTSGNYASGFTGAPANGTWDDESSDPVTDINDAIDTTLGNDPLVCVMGIEVFRALQRHPDITGAFQFTKEGVMASQEMIKGYFGFSKLLVGAARYNTATKGQTQSLSRIWGKHCAIYRQAPGGGLRKASFAHTITNGSRMVLKARDDMRGGGTGGTRIKVIWPYTVKQFAQKAGYLITNAVA